MPWKETPISTTTFGSIVKFKFGDSKYIYIGIGKYIRIDSAYNFSVIRIPRAGAMHYVYYNENIMQSKDDTSILFLLNKMVEQNE